jgi:hypothetical protein
MNPHPRSTDQELSADAKTTTLTRFLPPNSHDRPIAAPNHPADDVFRDRKRLGLRFARFAGIRQVAAVAVSTHKASFLCFLYSPSIIEIAD